MIAYRQRDWWEVEWSDQVYNNIAYSLKIKFTTMYTRIMVHTNEEATVMLIKARQWKV